MMALNWQNLERKKRQNDRRQNVIRWLTKMIDLYVRCNRFEYTNWKTHTKQKQTNVYTYQICWGRHHSLKSDSELILNVFKENEIEWVRFYWENSIKRYSFINLIYLIYWFYEYIFHPNLNIRCVFASYDMNHIILNKKRY